LDQPAGDLPEQFISGGMAKRIVNAFEAVEIQAKNRQLVRVIGDLQRFG